MSTATDDRQVRRRLAILHHAEEITGNVAMTCRYYGITRQSFYAWKRRYEELGLEGLKDRSRRPRSAPTPPTSTSSARSSTCASTTTSARQDRHVPPPLPRRQHLAVGSVADPQAPRAQPAAGLPALQAPRPALPALRKAAPRPPGPDRRQVHRPDRRRQGQQATTSSPPSTTAPAFGSCASTPAQPEDRHPVR